LKEGHFYNYTLKRITELANTRKSTKIWEVEQHIVGKTS